MTKVVDNQTEEIKKEIDDVTTEQNQKMDSIYGLITDGNADIIEEIKKTDNNLGVLIENMHDLYENFETRIENLEESNTGDSEISKTND